MTDNTVRTYRLPLMDDERVCPIEVPAERYANWDVIGRLRTGRGWALNSGQGV
jgi:hypothetical protein